MRWSLQAWPRGGASSTPSRREVSTAAAAPLGALKAVLQVCGAAYGTLLTAAFVGQRRMLYFPDPTPPGDPVALGAPGCSSWRAVTRDGETVHGWYWPARGGADGGGGKKRLTVLLLHGNAGHRGHRLGWMSLMLYHLRCNVCIVDYRGYGGSTGSPSEAGLTQDGVAAVEWLLEAGHVQAVEREVVYWGESIGTAVSVAVAEVHAPAAFIHQSGMSSIAEVAQNHVPLVMPRLLLLDKWNSRKRLGGLSSAWAGEGRAVPSLAIHGDKDGIVPFRFGKQLFASLPEPKRFYTVRGAGHNDVEIVGGARYWDEVKAFLKDDVLGSIHADA